MKMKRAALLAGALLLLGQAAFAQLIDKPVATVKLSKVEAITVKQFQQKVDQIEVQTKNKLSADDRRKVLDLLINMILINQAAAQENVTVAQAEIDSRLELLKKSLGAELNLGRELTDDELKSLARQQTGVSWDEYVGQLKDAIVQQKYVMQKKKALFDKIAAPTAAEIQDFYDANKTAFVAPDMVRFKHIFIDTRNLASKEERDKAKQRAEDIRRELVNGASFDDMVVKYSDDKASRYRGGDFGYLRRDDQARKQLLGQEFFEAPFKMKLNEVSGVLQSNVGFHIIKITEKIPFRLLGLDDTIPPQNTTTVRDQISAQLMQRKQSEVYQRATIELLDELKKKAEIRVFEENLT
jgi:peptidyl-prolyl cis-trans isomerase SurA